MNSTSTTPSSVFPKRHPAGLWVLFTTEMWERFCYYGMRAFLVYYLIAKSTADNAGLGWTEKEAYHLYGIYTGLIYLVPLFGGFLADRFIGQHRSVLWGGIIMALGEFTLAATELVRKGNGIPVNFQDDPTGMTMFVTGLALMIIGTGFFKPCISVMVGQLYGKDDPRRDGGFTIFYMGINIGAFASPLIAGAFAEVYGWHYGFITAGIGMIIGVIVYATLRPIFLPEIGLLYNKKISEQEEQKLSPEQIEARKEAEYEQIRPLTRVDYDRIFVIAILVLFSVAFWSAFEQAGSSLNIFAKKETDRRTASSVLVVLPKAPLIVDEHRKDFAAVIEKMVNWNHPNPPELVFPIPNQLETTPESKAAGETLFQFFCSGSSPNEESILKMTELYDAMHSEAKKDDTAHHQFDTSFGRTQKMMEGVDEGVVYTFPATWYQSVNALGIIIFAPIFAILWSVLDAWRIQPSTPVKFGIGLLLLSISFVIMVPGAVESRQTFGLAGPQWLVLSYLFATWGELCLSPVGLSMVTKLSPVRYVSFMMGLWFLSSALAGYLSGSLAAILGTSDDGTSPINILYGSAGGMADFFIIMAIIPAVAGFIVLILSPMLKRMMHGIQ
ncbi:MAG: peptide MFS transporter [Thermoguttaceae bacterium]